jgi:hypothetical protein
VTEHDSAVGNNPSYKNAFHALRCRVVTGVSNHDTGDSKHERTDTKFGGAGPGLFGLASGSVKASEH